MYRLIVVGVVAALALLRWHDPWLVETARLKTFDYYQLSAERTKSDLFSIVEIDNDDVDRVGQWPWPRIEVAAAVERMYGAGAALVVLPMVFSEPDRQGGDAILADVLPGAVVAQAPSNRTSRRLGTQRGVAVVGGDATLWLEQYAGVVQPLEVHASAAAGVGVVAASPEIDGVVRRVPLAVAVAGELYPSLALETLRVMAGDVSYQARVTEAGIESFRVPKYGKIPTDSRGRVWIRYDREFDTSTYSEMRDLSGRVAILTVSAEGAATNAPTPYGLRNIAEVQASLLSTLTDGTALSRPDWADLAEVALVAAAGLAAAALASLLSVYWTLPAVAALAGGIVWAGFAAYESAVLLDWSYALASTLLVALGAIFRNFIREYLQKLQIKRQFGSYLSPAMVERLSRDPSLLRLGGEERELSIMFTDVRGFTAISEHYGSDVQGLTRVMNAYMTAMTAPILRHDGTLDKYIGDAQMAFWNAPLDDEQHAKRAVAAGLDMLAALDEFNERISAEGVPPFGMGLGINTGRVVVGNMGSVQRFDYTCLGDSVNLASRLEGQSKPYGVAMVIGPQTQSLVCDEYATLQLDRIAVKGKREGVDVYTVLGRYDDLHGTTDYALLERAHEKMLELYWARSFETAARFCRDCTGLLGGRMDEYYRRMAERCDEYSRDPPGADWDGVYRATSK